MMVFDRAGNFITSWGSDLFTMAHGLTLGPDGHLYCVDAFRPLRPQVFPPRARYCRSGGTPDRNSGHYSGKPFNGPTKVAFDPRTHDLYVADGYGNARVHKYSAAGDHLFSWGEPGQGPGQFNLVHSVQTDRAGNVYVAQPRGPPGAGVSTATAPIGASGPAASTAPTASSSPRRAATGSWSTSARRAPASARTAACAGSATAWPSSSWTAPAWARIYHDSSVMQGPHGIGVDAEGNVYLTQVLWANGPWIDPMEKQMMIRLRRVLGGGRFASRVSGRGWRRSR